MDRPPTLRVKLPYYDDEFKCELYNMQQERVFPSPSSENATPGDFIAKGTNVAVVVQCGGLWFANGKLVLHGDLFKRW